jgi:hypothetical protein
MKILVVLMVFYSSISFAQETQIKHEILNTSNEERVVDREEGVVDSSLLDKLEAPFC